MKKKTLTMNSKSNSDIRKWSTINSRSHKEIFRIVVMVLATITITIIAHAPEVSASIFAKNYHHRYKYKYSNCNLNSPHRSSPTKSYHRRDFDLNTINLWNFRSLSSIQLAAQPPTSVGTSSSKISSSCDSDITTPAVNRNIGRRGRGRRYMFRKDQYRGEPESDILINEFTKNSNIQGRVIDNNGNDIADDARPPQHEPTIAEMRARLGPIGLLVANSVEVGIATASSYMSGGIFGYMIGAAMGVPSLFKESSEKANANLSQFNKIQGRIGNWNQKAFAQGKSWATLSASFSGFHALTRVCRGGVEDRWNSIIGSACAGAYLSRQGKFLFLSRFVCLINY